MNTRHYCKQLLIFLSAIPLMAARCSNIEQQIFPQHQDKDIPPAPVNKNFDERLIGRPTGGAQSHQGFVSGSLQGGRPTDTNKSGPVNVAINLSIQAPISPNIYGINATADAASWDRSSNFSFYRMGGNRMTAYNWENNVSHAGSDWLNENDTYLCSKPLPVKDCSKSGAVYKTFIDKAFGIDGSGLSANVLVTVPLIGHVAYKTTSEDVCPASSRSEDGGCKTRDYLSTLFRKSIAQKQSSFTLIPDQNDAAVYQDEFVNFLKQSYPAVARGKRQIFFSMDNELALWASTHRRLRPSEKKCELAVTYSEALKRNVEYAQSVKSVYPDAIVFGPVDYGWYSMVAMQGAGPCEGLGKRDFYDYYLTGLREASKNAGGKPLVDVLDFHWYSEVRATDSKKNVASLSASEQSDADADILIQTPRSMWDPSYVENSWITETIGSRPLTLLPRIAGKIARFNPSMGIAVTEYNMGGGNTIAGGLAQADLLGIFGREGIFAASFWPMVSPFEYIHAAFKMFRNYDGQLSTFGDLAVSAVSDSSSRASVYASVFKDKPGKLILVAINKTRTPLGARISLQGSKTSYRTAKVYQINPTTNSPTRMADFAMASSGQTGEFMMPPLSVSTLEFVP